MDKAIAWLKQLRKNCSGVEKYARSRMIQALTTFVRLPAVEQWMIILLAGLLMISALGIVLPETGVDALWFHLPLTKQILLDPFSTFLPDLYQSTTPRLASYLFVLPYAIGEEAGVKLVTFMLGLGVLVLLDRVMRLWKPMPSRPTRLLSLLIVLSFHTMWWQMTSAYADTLRTVFELLSIWWLFQDSRLSTVLRSGLWFGLALSTRIVSIVFLPLWFVGAWMLHGLRYAVVWLGVSLLIVSPWYLLAWKDTGDAFYGWGYTVQDLRTVAGSSILEKMRTQLPKILETPFLPVVMALDLDLQSPVILVLALPLARLMWKDVVGARMKNKKSKRSRKNAMFVFWFFILGYLLLWILISPRSVRYALTGFVLLAGMMGVAFQSTMISSRITVLAVSILICSLFLRIAGSSQNFLEYSIVKLQHGNQASAVFVRERFSTPPLDGIGDRWLSGYWNVPRGMKPDSVGR
mgnify:CR=1 FL=1